MNLVRGSAIAIGAGLGLIAGLLLDEIAWGLIVGAGIGVLIEAWSMKKEQQ